jgi:hypothetical protein
VDYACTNAYAVTIALPVTAGGGFAGVAAADVLVASVEERVLPWLCALSPRSVLATADGRVVASASPDYAPGLRVDTARAERVTAPPPTAALQWRLLEVPAR